MSGLGLLLLLAAAARAQTPPAAAKAQDEAQKARSAELSQHYDAAFKLYTQGDYSRAILEWNEVIHKAPDQASASKMIGLAREAIDKRDREKQELVFSRVAAGDYQGALVALQPLLEADPYHPLYTVLQSRLDRLSFVIPQASTATKAWTAAVRGLSGYVAREDDLQLAYDGLRRAKELDPREPFFERLIAVLLSDNPALAQDAVTVGMSVLEYKRFVALNLIYDGKYSQAVAVLERVVKLDPEDQTALKRLGSAYFALKQKDKARELWRRALALKPDDGQLKLFLAQSGSGDEPAPAAVPAQKE